MLLVLLTAPGLTMRSAFSSLQRDESFGEAAFSVIAVSVLISGWVALVLAELGVFSLTRVCLLAVLIALATLVLRRHRLKPPFALAPRVTVWGIVVLLPLGIAAWLFFRPNEYVLGGRDHGVYVNTGAAIARRGGILLTDPVLADVPPDRRMALTQYEPLLRGTTSISRTWHVGTSTPGYYLFHFDSRTITPHGFHLYPTWFAILTSANGVDFSLFLTPALAWLSLVAIVLTAWRVFGRGVALVAAGLMALNLVQLWYARTPSAEIMVQFLFWTGMWAWVRAIQLEDPVYAALGGLAWGQIHLAKVDYVMLPVVLTVWIIWLWWTGRYRRYHTVGLIAYGVMVTHALLHGLLVAPSYFLDVIAQFAPVTSLQWMSGIAAEAATPLDLVLMLIIRGLPFLVVALLILFAIGFGLRRIKGRGAAIWTQLASSQRSWLGLAIIIVGLGVYAYFRSPSADSASGTTTLAELGWYLGPLTIAVGTIGMARRMGQADSIQGVLMWSVFGLSVIYLVGGTFTYPDHFWAIRRFAPVVVPGFLLLAADAVMSMLPRRWVEWRHALIPLVVLSGMVFAVREASSPFLWFVENHGVTDCLRTLDGEFEPNAVLLFDRDAFGSQVGTPLQMIFERQVGFVDMNAPAPAALSSIVGRWQAANWPVYYLASTNVPVEIPGFSLDYLRTEVVAWQSAEQTVVFRPVRTGEVAAAFDVYRVQAKQDVEDHLVTLDVGPEASEPMIEGVYIDPVIPGLTTAQWTTQSARFNVPIDGRPRKILLRMGNTPSSISPIEVEVIANGDSLADIAVEPERMQVYTVRFPDAAVSTSAVVIELRMKTWNPRTLGLNADRRDLGVMVDWIKILTKRP
jgi:hypothetical protein